MKDKPWRQWAEALSADAARDAKEWQEISETNRKAALEADRAKFREMKEKYPELLKFSEELWPKLRQTEEGRREAAKWLREHRKEWEGSPASEECKALLMRLEKEAANKISAAQSTQPLSRRL